MVKFCHPIKDCINCWSILNFCEIQRKYQNSMAKEKFCSSALNFVACRKLGPISD